MTQSDDDPLALATRSGLPDALRVLVKELPRAGWESDPGFKGIASFWMERHLLFRQIMDTLAEETELRLDAKISAEKLGARVSRFGGMLIETLHEHHSIEDSIYFPKMRLLEPRLLRGFDMLDKDHHALDDWLDRFSIAAKIVVEDPTRDSTWAFHAEIERLAPLLERHLTDEEDLIVPVVLKTGLK
ncbi:hemerythrin domain-containing protein [Rhodobacteraceae bacterium SC52]|nr:hemerythrin domain-containing protein [Rhodobacteraceae bacterium SC52]